LITAIFWSFSSPSIEEKIIPIQENYIPIQTKDRYPEVRVCCLVHTKPINFDNQGRAVKNTWGSRCDGLFFISELSNDTKGLPIARIADLKSGYEHLTQKSTLAFKYAYEHHFNAFDWFLKTDDDTYIIMDNLKSFLSKKNTSQPVTFGYDFKDVRTDFSFSSTI
jgi:glycoprotein-N-acetylgalactosamine 3-beta-galactosyltransferase